ncbi:MAG: glycosyltransferase [Asticcacaulis sp.]
MPIINLMTAKGRGGLEIMALRYHEALEAAGFDVLSVGHPEGVLAGLKAFQPLKTGFSYDPLAALKFRSIARGHQADCVIAHGNRAIALAAHGWSGYADRTLAVVHNFRFKRDLSKVREALCVSDAVLGAVQRAYPALKVRVVEDFVPLVSRSVKAAPQDVPVIGVLGRLHVNKGFDVLLEAVARLRDEGVRVKLRIAGDGPEKDALIAQAARLGLGPEQLEFSGWVTPVEDFLAQADVFVLPSRVEPFGLVVAEAMAAGVPVIASHIDGPKTILKAGELGLMVPPEDPLALAGGLKAVFSDWSAALERARKAQAHALETYDQKAGQARLTAVLRDVGQEIGA